MKSIISFLGMFLLVLILFSPAASAENSDDRLNKLEDAIKKQELLTDQLQETIRKLNADIEQQKSNVSAQETTSAAQTPKEQAPKASGLFGGSVFTNPNLSLVFNAFYSSSSLTNDELSNHGVPGFTTQGLDQRNGFNFDSAELSFFSPVDPYFDFYANIPVSEDGVEVEEAYVVTTALPGGWQIKGGKFKSNFSRLDAQHPHAWDFFDIALPYRAFLGSEGLGGEKGIQITYLPEFPIYTQFGVEFLQGENGLLFGRDAEETPHAFAFFVKSSVDTSDYSTLYFGPSVLFGKTKNQNIIPGSEVTGNSALYGMEVVWKFKPGNRESLIIQSEYLFLAQSGDTTDLTTNAADSLNRKQDGFYIQGVWRKDRWGIGARYDTLDILSDTFKVADEQQNFGGKPWRGTASLEYNPTEFTRIRLQFSHDKSDTLTGRTNDEAVLQFNFTVGAHPAHSF